MGKKLKGGLIAAGGVGLFSVGITPLIMMEIIRAPQTITELQGISLYDVFVGFMQFLGIFVLGGGITLLVLAGLILFFLGIAVADD